MESEKSLDRIIPIADLNKSIDDEVDNSNNDNLTKQVVINSRKTIEFIEFTLNLKMFSGFSGGCGIFNFESIIIK